MVVIGADRAFWRGACRTAAETVALPGRRCTATAGPRARFGPRFWGGSGEGFGAPGYVRLAYCVKKDMIERSMPAFAKLIKEYK